MIGKFKSLDCGHLLLRLYLAGFGLWETVFPALLPPKTVDPEHNIERDNHLGCFVVLGS